jgi:hypothetical protein
MSEYDANQWLTQQKQRQLAIDERDNLIALLDITKGALSDSREIAQRYAAERDELRAALNNANERAKYWEEQTAIARDAMAPVRALQSRVEAALKILEEGRKS